MIPSFAPDGNLPPGIHWATWEEIADRFRWTDHRQTLLRGLRRALDELQAAGCRTVNVNGSFVTDRRDPGDFSACWDSAGVVPERLPATLVVYDVARRGMSIAYSVAQLREIATVVGVKFGRDVQLQVEGRQSAA